MNGEEIAECWNRLRSLFPRWQPTSEQQDVWLHRLAVHAKADVIRSIDEHFAAAEFPEPKLHAVLASLRREAGGGYAVPETQGAREIIQRDLEYRRRNAPLDPVAAEAIDAAADALTPPVMHRMTPEETLARKAQVIEQLDAIARRDAAERPTNPQ